LDCVAVPFPGYSGAVNVSTTKLNVGKIFLPLHANQVKGLVTMLKKGKKHTQKHGHKKWQN
jgi:hypothetical protein